LNSLFEHALKEMLVHKDLRPLRQAIHETLPKIANLPSEVVDRDRFAKLEAEGPRNRAGAQPALKKLREEIALPPLALAASRLPDRASRVLRRSVSCHASCRCFGFGLACRSLPSPYHSVRTRELRTKVEYIAKIFQFQSRGFMASARESASL
jgi:hypothetical protein